MHVISHMFRRMGRVIDMSLCSDCQWEKCPVFKAHWTSRSERERLVPWYAVLFESHGGCGYLWPFRAAKEAFGHSGQDANPHRSDGNRWFSWPYSWAPNYKRNRRTERCLSASPEIDFFIDISHPAQALLLCWWCANFLHLTCNAHTNAGPHGPPHFSTLYTAAERVPHPMVHPLEVCHKKYSAGSFESHIVYHVSIKWVNWHASVSPLVQVSQGSINQFWQSLYQETFRFLTEGTVDINHLHDKNQDLALPRVKDFVANVTVSS